MCSSGQELIYHGPDPVVHLILMKCSMPNLVTLGHCHVIEYAAKLIESVQTMMFLILLCLIHLV